MSAAPSALGAALQNATVTENGAASLPSTEPLPPTRPEDGVGGRLDLFFKAVRGLPEADLHRHLEAAWRESPLDTWRIAFQTRDCRGGKGERLLFRQMMHWLARRDPASMVCNLPLIPLYGRWDDVLFVPGGVALLARQLEKDRLALEADPQASISLAAKWAPTERHALDKHHRLVARVVQALGEFNTTRKDGRTVYRKRYLSVLRAHLKVVERAMCAREWSAIDYSHVPSRAMKNYRAAFERHDETRFQTWRAALAGGDTQVKAKQLFPHELVRVYHGSHRPEPDPVIEAQWKVLQSELQSSGTLSRSICVCDVSGSMQGEPMLVSIALGLLISSVVSAPFQDHVITFESTPQFHHIAGDTLAERVGALSAAPWGGSTNLQGVFDLILQRALRFRVAPSDMPQRLFIFSDMQFDQACGDNQHTNFEAITSQYEAAGYTRPHLVFWNLRGDTQSHEFPVHAHETGVSLLSGFSPSLLKSVLDGGNLTPWGILRTLLDDPRYSPIVCAGAGDINADEIARVAADVTPVPSGLLGPRVANHRGLKRKAQ